MENKIISIEQHRDYGKPKIWLPDRPECQLFYFSNAKRQEKGRQYRTTEYQVHELWERIFELQEHMSLLEKETQEMSKFIRDQLHDLEFEIFRMLDKADER